jgi:hypothetical protein
MDGHSVVSCMDDSRKSTSKPKRPVRSKDINGYNCREVVMTVSVHQVENINMDGTAIITATTVQSVQNAQQAAQQQQATAKSEKESSGVSASSAGGLLGGKKSVGGILGGIGARAAKESRAESRTKRSERPDSGTGEHHDHQCRDTKGRNRRHGCRRGNSRRLQAEEVKRPSDHDCVSARGSSCRTHRPLRNNSNGR